MRKALTLTCLLAVAHYVAAQCNFIQYTETFVPQCAPNDVYVRWPDYENPAYYYACNGVGNPVQVACPASEYFTYAMQACTPCSQFIPAVDCQYLKTQNPPNCVPIGQSGSTAGPPTGPTTGPTETPTPIIPTIPSITPKPSTTTTPQSTIASSIEPATPTIPAPPSPATNDPGVPTPPSPDPTPPDVPGQPPTPPVIG